MQSNRQERSTVYVRPVRNPKYGKKTRESSSQSHPSAWEDKTLQQQQQQQQQQQKT
jgi:hypothetical protein